MGSRASRGRLAAALIAGAIAVGVGWTTLRERAAPAPRGPGVVVRPRAAGEGGDSGAPDDAREERAMSLALASAPPSERRRLLDRMNYATARLEARLSPLGDDLGDDEGDAEAQFRREATRYAPALAAARALASDTLGSADLAVRLVAGCEAAPLAAGEECFALWDAPGKGPPLAERARFLAWAASRAAVFELASPAAAEACARVLRERVLDEASAIALVLVEGDLALREVPERPELVVAARRLGRAMAANELRDTKDLDAFARATPPGRAAPWLALGPAGVLVVPRLSALVRVTELAKEVASVPACAGPRWIHAP